MVQQHSRCILFLYSTTTIQLRQCLGPFSPQTLDTQLDVCILSCDHEDGLQSVSDPEIQTCSSTHYDGRQPTSLSVFLTAELGSEAESIIALILLVPVAIVTNASGGVLAAALVSGMGDRVLD